MLGESIGKKIFGKVAEKFALQPSADFEDLKTVRTFDGQTAGRIEVFQGPKVEKLTWTEMSLGPGMRYINVLLKPSARYNIPKFYLNHMTLGEKVRFDVDLYPAVDLVPRQDYLDRYYEKIATAYDQAKASSIFKWQLSKHAWLRVASSPFFFMADVERAHQDEVEELVLCYVDAWLTIREAEQEVCEEEARRIEERRGFTIKWLIERDPERRLLEKVFGKEVTARVSQAMV